MDKTTCVVIVNFNAGDALLRSVASVLAAPTPLRLVVADNASSDHSCARLRQLYGSDPRLTIRENVHNLGFARAVNACAMDATEPFLLILNPDCELNPDALAELQRALLEDSEAALAAPKVVDSEQRILSGTVRGFPQPWQALMTASGLWRMSPWLPHLRGVEMPAAERPVTTCRVDAVSGACMLLKTSLFQQFGGLDEAYGMHFEDLDLMYRLRSQRLYSLYVPNAMAVHQAGTSSRSRPWWVHRQKHLGLQRFFRQHYAGQYSLLSRGVMLLGIWLHFAFTLPLVAWRR